MSRVPVGKVLLRNVIRHTDAHNKIQEESEMWKMREMEKQTPVIQQKRQPTKLAPDFGRCKMRSDSFHEETHSERRGAPAGHTSEQDRREAKHWTKKLYDFEAGDPNRTKKKKSSEGKEESSEDSDSDTSSSSESEPRDERKKRKRKRRRGESEQGSDGRKSKHKNWKLTTEEDEHS
ncbi:hypothetical protein EOD39_17254 [Acipenser ruthenus]|uniref:Uncharacterized protein n=1 Tax=Acipenser ruthenus TaxID=7906 RepID=A0A444V3U7_ACIRT|nr:hypothetical protein EOD39_17254 [Acipenser ruthenus]